MLFLVIFALPALLDASSVVSNRQLSPHVTFNSRHFHSSPSGLDGRQISDRRTKASYENSRGNNLNDLYMASTQSPSLYEQEASSLVSDLLVTKLAEDCKYQSLAKRIIKINKQSFVL
jgi:hypothetical protein